MYIAEPSDKDGDGLLDEKDGCPTIAGRRRLRGRRRLPGRGQRRRRGRRHRGQCPALGEDPDDFRTRTVARRRNDKDACRTTATLPAGARDEEPVQDEDGCPDEKDTDNDACRRARQVPRGPEDTDGFQDEDGCSDPTMMPTGSRTPDECAEELETVNEFETGRLPRRGAEEESLER
jgi:hypothetical protein